MNTNNNNHVDIVDFTKSITNTIGLSTNTAIPAEVTKVISRSRVEVKPLIKIEGNDGVFYSRAVITDVPLINSGNSKASITYPVTVGDLGWLIACDRDITNFKSTLTESSADTHRRHNFSDSFFMLDKLEQTETLDNSSLYVLTDSDVTNIKVNKDELLLTNDNSSVSIKSDTVTVKNKLGSVELGQNNLSLKVGANTVEISGSGIAITGSTVTINGVVFSGSSTIDCTAIKSDSVMASGVEVVAHTHTGVQSGSSSTAPMS